jgi:hypothetical protein
MLKQLDFETQAEAEALIRERWPDARRQHNDIWQVGLQSVAQLWQGRNNGRWILLIEEDKSKQNVKHCNATDE